MTIPDKNRAVLVQMYRYPLFNLLEMPELPTGHQFNAQIVAQLSSLSFSKRQLLFSGNCSSRDKSRLRTEFHDPCGNPDPCKIIYSGARQLVERFLIQTIDQQAIIPSFAEKYSISSRNPTYFKPALTETHHVFSLISRFKCGETEENGHAAIGEQVIDNGFITAFVARCFGRRWRIYSSRIDWRRP